MTSLTLLLSNMLFAGLWLNYDRRCLWPELCAIEGTNTADCHTYQLMQPMPKRGKVPGASSTKHDSYITRYLSVWENTFPSEPPNMAQLQPQPTESITVHQQHPRTALAGCCRCRAATARGPRFCHTVPNVTTSFSCLPLTAALLWWRKYISADFSRHSLRRLNSSRCWHSS